MKTFGPSVALRGVDATLLPGALTLIEGANGSGKSTLLGILGTVVRATSGTVRYEPFGSDLTAVRGQLGWLSHETLAYRSATCDNPELHRLPRRVLRRGFIAH